MKRVYVITGASGRLGSRLCERLAMEHDVLGVYHHTPPTCPSQIVRIVDPLLPEIVQSARPIHVVRADLNEPRDINLIVEVCLA